MNANPGPTAVLIFASILLEAMFANAKKDITSIPIKKHADVSFFQPRFRFRFRFRCNWPKKTKRNLEMCTMNSMVKHNKQNLWTVMFLQTVRTHVLTAIILANRTELASAPASKDTNCMRMEDVV